MPGGRIPRRFAGRSARVVATAGRRASRHAATRLANLLRDDERARALLDERHREAAIAAAELLGSMKGGAMKLGQLASFVELDFIPPEYRDVYQEQLARLRDAAPAIEWPAVRRVLEQEWEAPPESVLEDLEHDPVAAASIGQVHRARLADGRRVAIKVQYPGVATAVETDVRTAMLMLRGARAISPGVDPKALAAELRDRVREQLEALTDPRNELVRGLRGAAFPPEELWFRRLALGVMAVCAQLRATRNWHRMAREWWFGDEPATELGRQEWAFLAGRRLFHDPRAGRH